MTTETPPPPGPRNRLEDEVLEILMRSDRPPTAGERARSWLHRRPRPRFSGVASYLDRLDQGLWLPVCIGLAIIAYMIQNQSHLLATLLAAAAGSLVVIQIIRSLLSPRRATSKRWRGREIDLSPRPRPLWIDRVWRKPPKPRR